MQNQDLAKDITFNFVDVLSNKEQKVVLGYRLNGAKPGPTLQVNGSGEIANTVYDRLMSIPTLPWMRGRFVLLRQDLISGTLAELEDFQLTQPVDVRISIDRFLPTETEIAVRRNQRNILRAATELGMISGRGVN